MSDYSDSVKNEKEELRFQYEKLRTEILQNEMVGLQLLGATLLLVAAMVGFAVSNHPHAILKVLIFTGASGISFLAMIQTFARIKSTFLLASYMRIFIEPYSKHIQWETRLKYFRDNEEKENKRYRYKGLDSYLSTYTMIVVANAVLTIIYTGSSYKELMTRKWEFIYYQNCCFPPILILMIICFINLTFVVYVECWRNINYRIYVLNYNASYDQKWKQAYEDMKAKKEGRPSRTLPTTSTQLDNLTSFERFMYKIMYLS